jgi:uncharacterized glyoxalase superfamily protein PhnB
VEVPYRATSPDETQHAAATFPNGMLLEIDNPILARLYNAGWRQLGGSSGILIGFSLPSREAVNQKYAQLIEAGYTGRQPPYDAFWGARYAILADPEGNDVGLMSPLDDERRSWPPNESPEP